MNKLPRMSLHLNEPLGAVKNSRATFNEFRYTNALRITSIVLTGMLLLAFLWTVWFVYTHVQNTISQVESIIVLQSELQIEPIDFARLESVEESWQRKHNPEPPAITRDPFRPTTTTAPVDVAPPSE